MPFFLFQISSTFKWDTSSGVVLFCKLCDSYFPQNTIFQYYGHIVTVKGQRKWYYIASLTTRCFQKQRWPEMKNPLGADHPEQIVSILKISLSFIAFEWKTYFQQLSNLLTWNLSKNLHDPFIRPKFYTLKNVNCGYFC